MSYSVLLLDDDAQFCASVIPPLEALDIHVIVAARGHTARLLIEQESPDLVIVDGLLPDTNGVTWIEELREDGIGLPVVFVSAFYRELATFRHLTQTLGVLRVIHKPVVLDRFAREIMQVLRTPEGSQVSEADARDDGVLYPEDDDHEAAVLRAKQAYASELPLIAQSLEAAIAVARDNPERPRALPEAVRQAHDIHGAAGTCGYPKISELAASIEAELRELSEVGRADWALVEAALARLRERVNEVTSDEGLETSSSGTFRLATGIEPAQAASSMLGERLPRVGTSILVLENDPAMIAYLRTVLEDTTITMRAAETPGEAVQLTREQTPDAIVIGWPLDEGVDAFRVLEQIRAVADRPRVPVVMLSLEDDLDTRMRAVDWGVDIFIAHPMEVSTLRHALDRLERDALMPPLSVPVLQDAAAAQQLRRAGLESPNFESLGELIEALSDLRPHAVLIGAKVEDVSACRLIRMSGWHLDCSLMIFGDQLRRDAFAADVALEHRVGWVAHAKHYAAMTARLRYNAPYRGESRLSSRSLSLSKLASGLAAATRRGSSYSVALLEVTDIRTWTPKQRALAGRYAARLLRGRLRQEDVRGLWGMHTYVLGLEGTTSRSTVAAVHRLRREAGALATAQGLPTQRLDIRAGLASYPLDGDTLGVLLAAATQRLALAQGGASEPVSWHGSASTDTSDTSPGV